jgi:hypothetical protein
MADSPQIYDIAVSFAGAQRSQVEPIVRACQSRGLRVFYDRDNTVDLWGRNFIYEMRKVYGGAQARYFVPFLSSEYLTSAFPMDEYHAAMLHAIKRGTDGYILPILVGRVDVPAELLNPAIGRLRMENYTTDELARIIEERIGDARRRHQEPRDVANVVEEAIEVRLPRIPPVSFSAYETVEKALVQVGQLFNRAAGQLEPYGMVCRVRTSETTVDIRVEDRGQQICGLRVRLTDTFRDDRLVVTFEWPRITSDGYNGWATAEWDPEKQQAKLKYVDFGSMTGQSEVLVTADEFFHLLWQKIVDFVEQARH